MERMRNIRATGRLLGIAAAAGLLVAGGAWADPDKSESNKRPYTSDFRIDDCTFVNEDTGTSNPLWLPLIPTAQVTLADDTTTLQITVCDASCDDTTGTELVDGVSTRVVEEREWEDGALVEVSRNFVARCEETNSIFYFGEEVDLYEDGQIVGHEGEWRAGVNDAAPGILMPGQFLLGSRYFQEVAPDVALDRAENAEMGLEVEVPYDGGTVYEGCVRVFETSDLSAGDRSEKMYCPGVGLVYDDGIELTDVQNF